MGFFSVRRLLNSLSLIIAIPIYYIFLTLHEIAALVNSVAYIPLLKYPNFIATDAVGGASGRNVKLV
jgi:hypothetical protein